MEFLKELDISNDTIEKVRVLNGSSIDIDFNCNSKEIIKIINYFKNIGIENIDGLLVEETDIFLNKFDDMKDKMENYGLSKAVNEINNDLVAVEDIMKFI